MIDLHLHTTASEGTLDPAALVARAHEAGVRTLSVTNHDTMAGVPAAAEAASRLGLEFLPGLEVYHPEHGASVQAHYRKLLSQHELAISGGSDFHGDGHHHAASLSSTVCLPRDSFTPLLQRLVLAHSVVHGGE